MINETIGKLGFGLMRLPKDGEKIDVEQTKQMVDLFMDAGFNYFDTAWAYDGSEEAIRKALVERYPRDSFYIASKHAGWIAGKEGDEALKLLDESLERAGLEYFDFYLIHNAGEWRTGYFDRNDLWNWALKQKQAGKFKHLGFSAHTTAEELDQLLTDHPEMEFVQLQLNYADWEDDFIQSRRCYEVARKHNIPIIVMEPVKGGMLATPPDSVKKVFQDFAPELSCASWAVRFAADLEGVLCVLSGMSNVEQMEDNLSYMKGFTRFTDDERAVLAKAREEMAKIDLIQCTACDYCAKVCPVNVSIAKTLYAINCYRMYGNMDLAKHQESLGTFMYGRKYARECIKCGKCEEVCTQHLKIRDHLQEAVDLFGSGAPEGEENQ